MSIRLKSRRWHYVYICDFNLRTIYLKQAKACSRVLKRYWVPVIQYDLYATFKISLDVKACTSATVIFPRMLQLISKPVRYVYALHYIIVHRANNIECLDLLSLLSSCPSYGEKNCYLSMKNPLYKYKIATSVSS